MEFTGINVSMLKNHFVFGGKSGCFMTQNMTVFVDAVVFRDGLIVVAKPEIMVPGYCFYLVKGFIKSQ